MLVNHNSKIVFIAVPKTGTTSLETEIMQANNEFEHNKVNGLPVHKHISARKLLKQFPFLQDYLFIGIVREPKDLVSSKYSFYREGRAKNRWSSKKKMFSRRLKVISAQFLSFHLWALLMPYSLGRTYVHCENAKFLVFRYTDKNINEVYRLLTGKYKVLPRKNTSKSYKYNLNGFLGKFIIRLRLNKELNYYESLP